MEYAIEPPTTEQPLDEKQREVASSKMLSNGVEREPEAGSPGRALLKHPAYSIRKLFLGSSSRLIYLVVVTCIGFFLTPFTVHTLGAEQFGLWALANAFIGYYSILDLGLSGAVFTHMSHALGARDEDEGSRIFSTGLVMFSAIGALVLLITFILAGSVYHLYQGHGPTIALVILICGFQMSLNFPMRAPYGVLNAGSHFETTSWVSIFGALLRTAITVYVLKAGYGVIGLAVGNLIAAVPGYIFILFSVRWKYPFVHLRIFNAWHKATAKKLFHFAMPVLVGQVSDRLRLQSDALIVSFALGLVAVAHYNVATTLVMYYMDGILAIIGVLTPVIAMQKSAGDEAGVRRSFFAGTRLAICTASFVGFGIVEMGHAFIQRWMGVAYTDAYPLLVILTIAMFFDLWQSTAVSALYATMNQNSYAALNFVEAVANVALSVLLVRRYGMIGVALGTMIPAIFIRTIVQPIIVKRKLGFTVFDYLAQSGLTLARMAVCLVAPTLLVWRNLQPNYPSIFIIGGISLVLFAVPAWLWEFKGIGSDKLARFIPWRTAEQQ